ncbi:MAG: hypothetical protein ACXU80_05095 [Xanthobacteraceae bacterium]
MADLGKYVVFKPVADGYVYAAPNTLVFGRRDFYLVNDDQKATILAIMTSSSRSVMWTIGASWIALSLMLGAGSLLWAYRSGYGGLSSLVVTIVLIVSAYLALLISRQLLLSRLRPILSVLPPTNERITRVEESAAIAKGSSAVIIGPARQRIAQIASVVGTVATVGLLISRAIDAQEANQSIWLAFFKANANSTGLFSIVAIVGFGFVFFSFGRGAEN